MPCVEARDSSVGVPFSLYNVELWGGTQVIMFGCRRLVFVLTLVHRGAWNGKHTGLVIRRKGGVACYPLPRRLGVDKFNSLVTFVLSVWLETFPAPDIPQDPDCRFFSVNLQNLIYGVYEEF